MRSKHCETIRYWGPRGCSIFSVNAIGSCTKTGYFLARFQALDLLKSLERANFPPSSHALAAVLGEVAEVPAVEVRDGPNDLDALKMVVYWEYERDITRWE